MREITRPAVTPPTLRGNGLGGRQTQRNLDRQNENPPAQPRFPSHWNNPDVRGVLLAVHWRVCAYCGCLLPRGNRGDVEHYRPKSSVRGEPDHGGYWWKAYDLDNYFLSCRVCNTSRKSNRFPLRAGGCRVGFADRAQLREEPRALWDPAEDTLDDWIEVDWKDDLVGVDPKPGLSAVARTLVETSLDFFKIRSDRHLVDERRQVRAATLDALAQGDDDRAAAIASRYRPHSLVARAILREHRPTAMPDAYRELEILLSDIQHELAILLDLMEEYPNERQHCRDLDEIRWCLAALLVFPPVGFAEPVREICRELTLLADIESLAQQLE